MPEAASSIRAVLSGLLKVKANLLRKWAEG